MATRPTTGSRTFASRARTARRHSTRIAARTRTGFTPSAVARSAGRSSRRSTGSSASARSAVRSETTGASTYRSQKYVAWSGRRTSNSYVRSRSWATAPLGGSTASPTMPFGSGSGGTSGSCAPTQLDQADRCHDRPDALQQQEAPVVARGGENRKNCRADQVEPQIHGRVGAPATGLGGRVCDEDHDGADDLDDLIHPLRVRFPTPWVGVARKPVRVP